MSKKCSVMAEFSLVPVGTGGTSVSRYVAAVVNAFLSVEELEFEVTPMSTLLAADNLSVILEAVGKAHEAVVAMGVKRVTSTLRIDDRRDKPRTMQDKVDAVKRQLKEA